MIVSYTVMYSIEESVQLDCQRIMKQNKLETCNKACDCYHLTSIWLSITAAGANYPYSYVFEKSHRACKIIMERAGKRLRCNHKWSSVYCTDYIETMRKRMT